MSQKCLKSRIASEPAFTIQHLYPSSNLLLLPGTRRGIHDKPEYARETRVDAVVPTENNNKPQVVAILGPPDDIDIFNEAEAVFAAQSPPEDQG